MNEIFERLQKQKLKIKLITYFVIILSIFVTNKSYSQQKYIAVDPLYIKYYKGMITLQGIYRSRFDVPSSILLMGNLKLNSSFFLWNPDFILFDIEGEYSPSINPTRYQGLPDMTEIINMNRFHGQTSIFSSQPFNLSIFADLSNSTVTRDYGINIHSKTEGYGASSSFMNTILPISVSYTNNMSKEKDILSGINFYTNSEVVNGSISRDIGDLMSNSFFLSYQKDRTQYFDTNIYQNKNFSAMLSNGIDVPGGFVQLHSSTAYSKTTGNYNYYSLDEAVSLISNLPYQFKINGNYHYSKIRIDSSDNIIYSPMVTLSHKLYSNLYSGIFFNQINSNQSNNGKKIYDEKQNIFGCNFSYTKRIPNGRFGFVYNFTENILNRSGSGSSVFIRNEEYLIEDGKQIELKYPKVIESSIVIKDASGTIIYQRNVDYLLVLVNNFYQILRIPSGRISDKSTVYIDYIPEVMNQYKYDLFNQSLSGNLSIFDGLLSVYLSISENKYKNAEVQDISLLRVDQLKTAGFNLNLGKFNTSGNYSKMNSNISTYSSFDLNCSYYNEISEGLSANISTNLMYLKYENSAKKNINAYVNFRLKYNFSSWMYANLVSHYRYANIIATNLSYLSLKAELKIIFYQTLISLGFDFYNVKNETAGINTYGLYLKLERAFGYF